MRRDEFGRDAAQIEALTAAEDGGEDLLRLGRGEDELDVRRAVLRAS